ncbi:MAG: Zonular occludens toxin [Gammaproteobacteria bacterium]|nr:MAG: Zonular occludens toxin [Gammaproteobacteria bacterium]
MTINAYTGLVGTGKTYECVKSVILPAVLSGRNVITNIDGIDNDAIRSFLSEKHSVSVEKLGHIKSVSNDDVLKPGFFPTDYSSSTPEPSVVAPGDLVCIDEAWKFWAPDSKISTEHRIFFREHRHFVNPDTGVSSDLIVLIQDISDLHRVLKVVVELTFKTHKLKAIGRNNNYNVTMWQSYKLTKTNLVNSWINSYDPEIFPLYKSYSGTGGKESQTDSRQNIFMSGAIKLKILFVVFAIFFGVYKAYTFFHNKITSDTEQPVSQSTANNSSAIVSAPSANHSSDWYIVGTTTIDGFSSVILSNGTSLRFESTSKFSGYGSALTGIVDGKSVTRFSNKPKEKRI